MDGYHDSRLCFLSLIFATINWRINWRIDKRAYLETRFPVNHHRVRSCSNQLKQLSSSNSYTATLKQLYSLKQLYRHAQTAIPHLSNSYTASLKQPHCLSNSPPASTDYCLEFPIMPSYMPSLLPSNSASSPCTLSTSSLARSLSGGNP